jgi:cytochrome c oxidase cbb3-type subunit 3
MIERMDFSKRNLGLAAVLLTAALSTAVAQGPSSGERPAPQRPPARNSFLISRPVPDPAAVERGQKNFVASCGFCHGTNANGGEGGPDLIRSVLALDDDDGDKIGPVILKGRPDKGMPPFAMTDAQIKDIASFLRARQQAAINRGAYPIQNVVTGNAKSGEAFFNGAGRCNTCHSPTGDLAGIGKKYEPVALQSRMLYPGPPRRNRGGPQPKSVPTLVTVKLPSGKSVTGTLEYLDDFTVSLRESSGDYYSVSRDPGVKVDIQDPRAAHAELVKKYTDAQMHDVLAYLVTLQ